MRIRSDIYDGWRECGTTDNRCALSVGFCFRGLDVCIVSPDNCSPRNCASRRRSNNRRGSTDDTGGLMLADTFIGMGRNPV